MATSSPGSRHITRALPIDILTICHLIPRRVADLGAKYVSLPKTRKNFSNAMIDREMPKKGLLFWRNHSPDFTQRRAKPGIEETSTGVIETLECPFALAFDPVLAYLRCPTAIPARPNRDTCASFFHYLRTLFLLLAHKNALFPDSQASYSPLPAPGLPFSPTSLVTTNGLFSTKRQL